MIAVARLVGLAANFEVMSFGRWNFMVTSLGSGPLEGFSKTKCLSRTVWSRSGQIRAWRAATCLGRQAGSVARQDIYGAWVELRGQKCRQVTGFLAQIDARANLTVSRFETQYSYNIYGWLKSFTCISLGSGPLEGFSKTKCPTLRRSILATYTAGSRALPRLSTAR